MDISLDMLKGPRGIDSIIRLCYGGTNFKNKEVHPIYQITWHCHTATKISLGCFLPSHRNLMMGAPLRKKCSNEKKEKENVMVLGLPSYL